MLIKNGGKFDRKKEKNHVMMYAWKGLSTAIQNVGLSFVNEGKLLFRSIGLFIFIYFRGKESPAF